MNLYIDLETYCELDLRKVGVYRYVEHPSFQILLTGYSFDGAPAVVVDGDLPKTFLEALTNADITKVAHNANFDRVALSSYLFAKAGEYLDPAQWRDTMAQALVSGNPAKLDSLAQELNVGQKDSAGTHLINYFSKPYKGQQRRPQDALERWGQFKAYCAQDVNVLVQVDQKLPRLDPREQKIWELDQKINDRGMFVDIPLAQWAEQQNSINSKEALTEIEQILGIGNGNSVAQVRAGLEEIGLELADLRADTVEAQLASDELTAPQRRALELRAEASLTAAKKYTAAIQMTNDDGRFRGGFRYFGAHTGRFSGRGIQLQNLPRAQLKYPNAAIADFHLGNRASAETLKALVRSILIGPFIVSDFSAIEARVLAWISGEQWALEAFATGRDIYVETANKMGGLTRDEGKLAVLALGYGGGVGALKAFGEDGDPGKLERFKSDWRKVNKNIVDLWYSLEECFERGSGKAGKLTVTSQGKDRYIHLPSGRKMTYRNVRREKWRMKTKEGEIIPMEGLRFSGTNGRMSTYGGRLAENVTQAIARDLLTDFMVRLDQEGHRLVGHVHDEVIIESGEETSVAEIEQLMSEPPQWAKGLPLGAEGFRTHRYRKG